MFTAEIVEMNLSGIVTFNPPFNPLQPPEFQPSPVDLNLIIRKDPTESSIGELEITDHSGGLYHIDSFFDVFTELSVDDGNSWIDADTVVRMNLTGANVPVPEPATFMLLGLGTLAMRRKRRNA